MHFPRLLAALSISVVLLGCKHKPPKPSASPLANLDCAQTTTVRSRVFDDAGALRPVTLSSDLFLVSNCGTAADRLVIQQALRREEGYAPIALIEVTLEKLLAKLTPEAAAIATEASRVCGGDLQCTIGIAAKPGLGIEAGPGGKGAANFFASAYNCGLFHSTVGHYEYTFNAALKSGFSPELARFLGTATQDVDTYEWFVAAAHAQVPNVRRQARFEKTPALARVDFVKWQQCRINRLVDACAKPVAERLYWMGYAMHAVQDLVFHQGVSNAEHSYRDHALDEGVDCWSTARGEWANAITLALMKRALETVAPACKAEMLAAQDSELSDELRVRLVGQPDRVGPWLKDYFAEGDAYGVVVEDHVDDEATYLLKPRWLELTSPRDQTIASLVEELFAANPNACSP